MAYIDKELFKQDIKMRYCNNCARPNEIKCRACHIDDMLSEIEDAPIADVAEVKRGKWEGLECSICGHFATYANDYNYCPQCGTKMDAERNDEDVNR